MFVLSWQHIDQTTEAIKAHNVYSYLQSWKFFMSTEVKKVPLVLSILNCKPQSLYHVVNLVPSSSRQFRFKGQNNMHGLTRSNLDEKCSSWKVDRLTFLTSIFRFRVIKFWRFICFEILHQLIVLCSVGKVHDWLKASVKKFIDI